VVKNDDPGGKGDCLMSLRNILMMIRQKLKKRMRKRIISITMMILRRKRL
jgi:hypothetical protein